MLTCSGSLKLKVCSFWKTLFKTRIILYLHHELYACERWSCKLDNLKCIMYMLCQNVIRGTLESCDTTMTIETQRLTKLARCKWHVFWSYRSRWHSNCTRRNRETWSQSNYVYLYRKVLSKASSVVMINVSDIKEKRMLCVQIERFSNHVRSLINQLMCYVQSFSGIYNIIRIKMGSRKGIRIYIYLLYTHEYISMFIFFNLF